MNNNPIRVLLIDDDEDDYILTRDWFSEFQSVDCQLEWVNNYQAGLDATGSIASSNRWWLLCADYSPHR
jgi:two-component system, cell cycle sensor histidine kinase and response regulator CckA